MDTLEDLNRKLDGAKDIKSIVEAMKAMAASNISQYEAATASLGDYYYTVTLGIKAYISAEHVETIIEKPENKTGDHPPICVIVFGSDLGLVGRFNDVISEFVLNSINGLPGEKEIWIIGERVQAILKDSGFPDKKFYPVPSSMDDITPLVRSILIDIEKSRENSKMKEFYVFHNQPKSESAYEPVMQRLLPLDEQWMKNLASIQWPSKNLPEITSDPGTTLSALINEYIFVSVYKACADSLAAENASRLEAMQRAETNITNMLDSLGKKFQSLRQSLKDKSGR
jgi:F-type H+-transporting ATPase subunit gamma